MGRVSDAPLDASYGGVHISSVRAAGHKTEGQDGAAKTTLGDLLYTNAGKVYATEDDWVRLVQSIAAGDQVALHSLQEQNRIVRNALTVLTPEERQTIETAFFSELTYVEAAAQLNQPLGTVKTRIRSGLGKLRQVLGATLKKRI